MLTPTTRPGKNRGIKSRSRDSNCCRAACVHGIVTPLPMASIEQRRAALQDLDLEEIKDKFRWLGSGAVKKEDWSKDRVINQLLTDIGKRDQGDKDKVDERLGIPTDIEQNRQMNRAAAGTAERSADAAEDSARSARASIKAKWVAIWISIGAALISLLAITVSVWGWVLS